jgi:magnesium chelatase subunit D
MTSPGAAPQHMAADATLAAKLFAIDSVATGIALRASAGPVRDLWLSQLRSLVGSTLLRRLPLNISDDRLLGGVDLTATLRSGRLVAERGLLAEADGGIVVVAMAERLAAMAVARITRVQDVGSVAVERAGLGLVLPARIGLIALDEGIAADERPPAPLMDRLAFHIDLTHVALADLSEIGCGRQAIEAAANRLPKVTADADAVSALCGAAMSLGIASARAPLFALQVARIAAALAERSQVDASDLAIAARLVLAPRATRDPRRQAEENAGQPPPPEQTPHEGDKSEMEGDNAPDQNRNSDQVPASVPDLSDLVVEAAASALPLGLLKQFAGEGTRHARRTDAGRAGASMSSTLRGRPIGTRSGQLRQGRLNIVETLRAAAPWQALRRREMQARNNSAGIAEESQNRLLIRTEDFRLIRYEQRTQTTTIFAVDASGSSALHRLAEAKGAVELLLNDCYVRRDHVAVLAFRGQGTDMVLPPTRSLVRAKRSLAALPAGGATPLASGIAGATALAENIRRHGHTPVIVILTDGRANVARDGTMGRPQAMEDALGAARNLRQLGCTALLIDTSTRPQALAERMAREMGGRYLPLPYADATKLSEAVRLVLPRG